MIYPISFRMQLSPEGHSSELLFSSILLTPAPVWLCVFLSLWCSSLVGRGYKSLCRSQSSPSKLYTWPRRCCFHLKLVQYFYIMWSTIKFHISNFAGEKKMIYHIFILITAKICWGQSSSHATGRSCELHHPFLSHLGLSAFIYCYIYSARVFMHAHPFLLWITFSLYLAHASYLFLPI